MVNQTDHGLDLLPEGEPLSAPRSASCFRTRASNSARKILEQLTEQARHLYHSSCPPLGISAAGRL